MGGQLSPRFKGSAIFKLCTTSELIKIEWRDVEENVAWYLKSATHWIAS